MQAYNERFHASGGAYLSDTERVIASFALFRALPIPLRAWKPPSCCLQADNKIFGEDFMRL